MRPFAPLAAVLVVLALLAAGGGVALAAATHGATAAEAPVAKRPMRGPQPARKAEAAKPPPARLPVAFNRAASPVPADPGQCRLACAQAYYFCLAGEEADGCPAAWTRCRADCARAAAGP